MTTDERVWSSWIKLFYRSVYVFLLQVHSKTTLTQAEVGKHLNMSQPHVSLMKNGECTSGPLLMATILQVDPSGQFEPFPATRQEALNVITRASLCDKAERSTRATRYISPSEYTIV